MKDFRNQLAFLVVGPKAPEIVVDASIPVSEISFNDRNGCIIKCAEYICEDILKFAEKLPDVGWPPSLEELNGPERVPPSTILLFLRHLLSHDQSSVSEGIQRRINSYASDIISSVTKGKTIDKSTKNKSTSDPQTVCRSPISNVTVGVCGGCVIMLFTLTTVLLRGVWLRRSSQRCGVSVTRPTHFYSTKIPDF